MTTCQIAFVFKNRVFCLQEFSSNTSNVFQQMKTTALRNLSAYVGQDDKVMVMETMAAGSHVLITSDEDALKYIFGCAVDGKAKIRVKFAKKPKALKEKHAGMEAKSDSPLEMPVTKFVDQTFIRKVIELLDVWADVEISYDETHSLIEGLKASILARDSLASLIQTLVYCLDESRAHKWTIPRVLSNRFDSWIAQASEEELLLVADQVPAVLDKLMTRRGKLFEDVFIKQKSAKQILKIRLLKSAKRGRRMNQKEDVVPQYPYEADESKASREMELNQLAKPVQKQYARKPELQVPLEVKKEEPEVVSSSDSEDDNEKKQKRQAKFTKKMEKAGCKTVEELHVLTAINNELKRDRAMEKYGCSNEQELKQAKKEERLARQLARFGCQNEDELSQVKLAKKLQKNGCQTVEEWNALRKQRKVAKLNPILD